MRSRIEKKIAKKEKKAYSKTVSEIINKVKDTQSITDKKLEELSRYCLKDCKVKD